MLASSLAINQIVAQEGRRSSSRKPIRHIKYNSWCYLSIAIRSLRHNSQQMNSNRSSHVSSLEEHNGFQKGSSRRR
jgi:hypothetical protein